MLSIANTQALDGEVDEPNLSLAPEEIASLTSLMKQYDQVLLDIDALNARLQELLDIESPPKTESPEPPQQSQASPAATLERAD